MQQRVLRIAEAFFQHPTAPFHEHRVREHIKAFCTERGLAVRQDRMGNVVATFGGAHRNETFAFEAHMDHPGFIVEKDSRRGRTTALFYGGVDKEYFAGTKVRVFGSGCEVTGRVTRVEFRTRERLKRAWLEVDGEVRRGDLAMWDLVPFRVRGEGGGARGSAARSHSPSPQPSPTGRGRVACSCSIGALGGRRGPAASAGRRAESRRLSHGVHRH